ncbi:response regulator [Limnofasciculus baicalensis]|uniref:Response regulator n=1 Tax=Limnofasciculus baicalensis BBK-W-15 TaxID=2699891 RepID=A0AAE3KM14_9CYAN|nr:response regulator [Limnofasciculus baicalensis]MCP2728714.1 response regulator [Limnofasciculus baicalensis BBK-W-15]
MATKRVLVIDDEEAIQEVIQGCLEDVGEWETLLAGSGSEGIRLATDEAPDAILLDVSMPEIDGVETFRKLQDHPITKNIPVILLTAKVQPADRIRFAELGIAGVIAKPFNPMTLVELVAEILGWELKDEG